MSRRNITLFTGKQVMKPSSAGRETIGNPRAKAFISYSHKEIAMIGAPKA
jgi:hypothetical protein